MDPVAATPAGLPVWLQALIAVMAVVGPVLGIIIGGMYGRNKVRADTAKVYSEIALSQLTQMEKEISRQGAVIEEYRTRVGGLERRERELIPQTQPHVEWDFHVLTEAARAGLVLPPMPPIFPTQAVRVGGERTRATDQEAHP